MTCINFLQLFFLTLRIIFTCNISSLILSTDGFVGSYDDCGLPCKSSQNGGFILQTCIERDATNLTMPSLQPSDEL